LSKKSVENKKRICQSEETLVSYLSNKEQHRLYLDSTEHMNFTVIICFLYHLRHITFN